MKQEQRQQQGEKPSKPDSIFEQTTWIPGNDKPGMGRHQQKDEHAERSRQQQEQHNDQ
jgi:hypothetical protein